MTTDALTALVGDVPGFVARSFGRRPLHVPAAARSDAADPAALLTLDDVDDLVASSGLRAPAFRVVRDGVTLPTSAVTRRVRIGSRPVDDLVDVAAVHAAFRDGATVVLQGLHRSFPPVAALCRELSAELGHPVQANAYLTPPSAQGLHLHGDPHDVFAVQTHGRKRWVVHPPGDEEPWDLDLVPGDVLYLPAGTRHAAQTPDVASLHLTLGVRTVTWRAVLERTLTAALEGDTDLDAPLPVGWVDDPDALGDELARRVADVAVTLAAGPDVTAPLRAAADRVLAAREPDRRGGLRDLLEVTQLDDTTPLRVRAAAPHRLGRSSDGAMLHLADRDLTLPVELAPVLARIAELGRFRPADLDDLIARDSRIVLCRRLVREGWLTHDRA
ncbi:cupin [Nitriliruptoraceae bacterium ZYF776]|nr:cupin [Profundirhabdus halotolerans]